jgi:succinate dehydrogenase / fumarate reductase flavoprotein subunit/fumarate reductase flavoprotein subunit
VPEPAYDTLTADVVVVGSGGAGLMCLLHLARRAPGLDVVLVSKGAVGRSGCTRMVQGGYNAVLDPRDSLDLHFADTLKGGSFLNDQELAWTLVHDAPGVIGELERECGCLFDRTADNRLHQKAFAGQSFDRTVHRGDLTGIEIMSRLRDQALRLAPRELEDVRALDLVLDADGAVAGLTVLDAASGRLALLQARVVVVATGGSATMYRIAAPAREKTGDGIAMCLRAGLAVRDMEMLQFHPTGLLAGDSLLTGSVLEEGLRGAGAHLTNGLGERFMERYDPERLERSTRDVVARSSYLEIVGGRGTPQGGVLLDISHLGADEVERRFGGMVERTRLIGSDLAREPVEVSPTAHFQMGGVLIDRDCRTSIEGLLVAGEDAGGTHGANRLGGNGVAESTVFGARAGDVAVDVVVSRRLGRPEPGAAEASFERALAPLRGGSESADVLMRELKEVMWRGCGLVRSRDGLTEAARAVDELLERSRDLGAAGGREWNLGWNQSLDVVNQLQVAQTMVVSALLREESRGAHFREDFPEQRDDEWLRYIVARRTADGEVETHTRPVELTRSRPPAPVAGSAA